MSAEQHRYGWHPELPDYRDRPYLAHMPTEAPLALPASMDLKSQMPPVYNQSDLGSCTANSTTTMVRFVVRKQGLADEDLSRLFNYYEAGVIEGSQDHDSGRYIRDAVKVYVVKGGPPEADWPYITGKFSQQPPQKAYDDAVAHEALTYLAINNESVDEMKSCLAAGFPFVIGFSVYENFESAQVAQDGIVGMPSGRLLGGHAVCVYGYDDATQRFKARNSWGEQWGQAGDFTIPYAYFSTSSLADDAWTIRSMSIPPLPPPPPPPPEIIPVITIVEQLSRKKHIIFGQNFDPDTALWLDSVETQAGVDGQRFLLRGKLTVGLHSVTAVNSDGKSSLPFEFTVE